MIVEKKMRISVGEEDSFYEALVPIHDYQIILIPGSKLNFIYDEK